MDIREILNDEVHEPTTERELAEMLAWAAATGLLNHPLFKWLLQSYEELREATEKLINLATECGFPSTPAGVLEALDTEVQLEELLQEESPFLDGVENYGLVLLCESRADKVEEPEANRLLKLQAQLLRHIDPRKGEPGTAKIVEEMAESLRFATEQLASKTLEYSRVAARLKPRPMDDL